MSLKAFHIVFIIASTLLTVGFGAWALNHFFSPEGGPQDLVFAVFSVLSLVGLLLYGKYFLKKYKHLSYE
jgi:hypothetical protein